ncbi:hypothetical protein AMTR_s00022p00103710 [Amborella trichopoda]|uniref:Wall-associated receptor kinase galacturonan-binding domain-containing protein n=1 Tax=Amborella trichopoda TaxID=13333 RepID=W1PTV8_AMBTC|nr:hypothetical protein AMTR_s00022p00103710 [Amborella trichopoda]
MAKPGCEERCGDREIPYPFGMGHEGCFMEAFDITCNRSFIPPKPFIGKGNLQVLNISLVKAEEVRVNTTQTLAYSCTNGNNNGAYVKLRGNGPYTISNKTVFTTIGCDAVGTVVNGLCAGIGCCQTTLPKHKKHLRVFASSLKNHTLSGNYSWCSYDFLAELENCKFIETDLHHFLDKADLAIVLEWAIGKGRGGARRLQIPPAFDMYVGRTRSTTILRGASGICVLASGAMRGTHT